MSDFHYVRTIGPEGGVDAAEGRAIGLDLEAVLDKGLPPYNIAIQIIAACAEILAIAEEDHVVHGDLDLGDVFIDNTGAVSIEGFGQTTTLAPEGKPSGPPTDRFGLGAVAYAMLSPRDLPQMPEGEEAHENAAIDAILALNLEGLPEDLIGDIQWYVARLLAWQPSDRPSCLETWRAFGTMNDLVDGPPFALWCEAALEGGGARRDVEDASRPMKRPFSGIDDTTMSDGPMPKGSVSFEDGDSGRSTAFWTRRDMKKAMQRALASDYREAPDQTDWMPGTPVPSMERHTAPAGPRWSGPAPVPKRAPGKANQRLSAQKAPEADPDTDFEFSSPGAKKSAGTVPPETTGFEKRAMRPAPTPQPAKPRRNFKPAPEAPRPPAGRPKRPKRSMAPDPDTAPQLVQKPRTPAPPPQVAPSAEPNPIDLTPVPIDNRTDQVPTRAQLSGPIPEADLSRGPDPFADIEETTGPPWMVIAGVAFLAAVALIFCLGVGGVGGMAALVGVNTSETLASKPPAKPGPNGTAVAQAPKAGPEPIRKSVVPISPTGPRTPVVPAAPPTPSPNAPTPRPEARLPLPGPSGTPPRPANPQPMAAPTHPTTVQPTFPQPGTQPAPGMFVPDPVDPMTMRLPSVPTEGLAVGDSILPFLVPEPAPNPDGSGPSEMQQNMRAHLAGATAARNAVILGDAEGAKAAARGLEFINPPDALPPSWLPYVIDLKMEAWLMENSPDLPAAAFKVAQIGQSCATCHEGVRAGPVVTTSAVPDKFFAEKDVMKRHAWAVDWMWVGLLANDADAWKRGADELAGSPFPSVILQDFPDQGFMKLEDKLHTAATEGQSATTPDQRALVFGRMLATCSRCHKVYRDNK